MNPLLRHYLHDSMPEDADIPALTAHLHNYAQLQAGLRKMTPHEAYFLLVAEIRTLRRPTFVRRLKQRLRAAVMQDLDQLIAEIPKTIDLGE